MEPGVPGVQASHAGMQLTTAPAHDFNNDFVVNEGYVFLNRYEVVSFVGKGTFGKVIKAYDLIEDCFVALKIVKLNRYCVNEVDILEKINREDLEDKYVVKLKAHFLWGGYLCLVFELLYQSLKDVLRKSGYRGLKLTVTRKFAEQLCNVLLFLRKQKLNIIHCDLKPDNILLCSPEDLLLKVIDFGNSCQVGNIIFKYIQTRFYRSPEVLLGRPYDMAIDMWSLGCILVEIHTGRPLFSGFNECDQMNKIVEVLGMPPKYLLDQASFTGKFFDRNLLDGSYRLKGMPFGRQSIVPNSRPLNEILGMETGGPFSRFTDQPDHSKDEYLKFQDLVLRMLDFDPETRITPYDALQHNFFNSTNEGVIAEDNLQADGDDDNFDINLQHYAIDLEIGGEIFEYVITSYEENPRRHLNNSVRDQEQQPQPEQQQREQEEEDQQQQQTCDNDQEQQKQLEKQKMDTSAILP